MDAEKNIERAVVQATREGVVQRGRVMAYSLLGGRQEPAGAVSALTGNAAFVGEAVRDVKWGKMELGGLVLEHVAVDCTMSKHIVTTALNGRHGTVKEWVSNGDVVITATIKVFGSQGLYPRDEVKKILDALKEPETLKVVNEVLNNVWDVQRVVVTSLHPSGRTERNYEEIAVGMVSDEEYVVE